MARDLFNNKITLLLIFGFCCFLGLALDLVTKSFVFRHFAQYTHNELGRYELIRGVVGINLTFNSGIIWGMFQGNNIIFLIVSFLAIPLIVAMWFLMEEANWLVSVGLGFILAGTLGNLYDRIIYRAVRDFIDVYLVNWPIFNLADTWITIGVIFIILSMLVKRKVLINETDSVSETGPATT
jgi:signal peptidase II